MHRPNNDHFIYLLPKDIFIFAILIFCYLISQFITPITLKYLAFIKKSLHP